MAAVGHRRAPRHAPLVFHVDVERLEADERGIQRDSHRERIVEREGLLPAPVLSEREQVVGEVVDEPRDRRAAARQRRGEVRAAEHHLEGGVERDQLERQVRAEDGGRRLGVDVEVELGRRGHVAGRGDRPAHDHDSLHAGEAPAVALEGDARGWSGARAR